MELEDERERLREEVDALREEMREMKRAAIESELMSERRTAIVPIRGSIFRYEE